MTGFGSFDNSMSKRVLDLLEASYLRLGEVVIERITVVKFGMTNRGGDGGSCLGIEVRADAPELTDMARNKGAQCSTCSTVLFAKISHACNCHQ